MQNTASVHAEGDDVTGIMLWSTGQGFEDPAFMTAFDGVCEELCDTPCL